MPATPTVVLPLGATEQHGPHLPAGTDFFTVDRLAQAAAERAATEIAITVAPALPFGSSDHHLIFGATLSLRTDTYYRVLNDLLRSLVTDGFHRIFLLNGHGGNHELAQLAARDIKRQIADKGLPSWTHPVISGGRLYVRNQGTLASYDVRAR